MASDEMLCKLCLEKYDDDQHIPRLIPDCGHTFCSLCIQRLMTNRTSMQCPIDQHRIQIEKFEISSFPKNFSLIKLIESIEGGNFPDYCKVHQRKFIFFCFDDKTKLCGKCIKQTKHENHDTIDILDLHDEIRSNEKTYNDLVKDIDSILLSHSLNTEALVSDKERQLFTCINEVSTNLINIVKKKTEEILTEICWFFGWIRNELLSKKEIFNQKQISFEELKALRSKLSEKKEQIDQFEKGNFDFYEKELNISSIILGLNKQLLESQENSKSYLSYLRTNLDGLDTVFFNKFMDILEKLTLNKEKLFTSISAGTNFPFHLFLNQSLEKSDHLPSYITTIANPDLVSPLSTSGSFSYSNYVRDNFQRAFSSFVRSCLSKEPSIQEFSTLVQGVNSINKYEQYNGIIGIRKLITSEHGISIKRLLDSGLIPSILNLCNQKEEFLQLEAVQILTSCAYGTASQAEFLYKAGAIKQFMNLLESPREEILEQAIWGLGMIASACPECRDQVIQDKGFHKILNIIKGTSKDEIVGVGTWALSCLCQGIAGLEKTEINDIVEFLMNTLQSAKQNAEEDAAWALVKLLETDNKQCEIFYSQQFCDVILKAISEKKIGTLVPIVKILEIIFLSHPNEKSVRKRELINFHQRIGNHKDFVRNILELIYFEKSELREEGLNLLKLLISDSSEYIDLLIQEKKNIHHLLNIALGDSCQEICKIAGNLIIKLVEGADCSQLSELIDAGILDCFTSMLILQNSEMVGIGVDGLISVMKAGTKITNGKGINIIKEEFIKANVENFLKDYEEDLEKWEKVSFLLQFIHNEEREKNGNELEKQKSKVDLD